MQRIRPGAIVSLQADPSRRGRVLEIRQKVATVLFDGYPRPTLHSARTLVLVSPSSQLCLFAPGRALK